MFSLSRAGHFARANAHHPTMLSTVEPLLAIALLVVGAVVCALALRSIECPGWALIGGVLAGVLLGPTLLGRVMPVTYEHTFVGGVAQREQLQQLQGRYGADLLAAEHAGADSDVLEELRLAYRQQRIAAEHALMQARWDHQFSQRILAVTCIVLVLLGSRAPTGRAKRNVQHGLIAPMTIGLWAAALPGVLTVLAATWWWQQDATHAALLASAVMIGPWALTRVDRIAAEQTERGGSMLMHRAGHVATLVALATVIWSAWTLRHIEGVLWALPLLALAMSWLRPATPLFGSTAQRTIQSALHFIVIPTLAASVAVKIELLSHFAFWPLLVLLILSGDGRWIGAVCGMVSLGGRRASHAMKLALGAMACGPTQLAVIAIVAHTWMLEMPLIYALLVGAVYIEISVPLRRWFNEELSRQSELR